MQNLTINPEMGNVEEEVAKYFGIDSDSKLQPQEKERRDFPIRYLETRAETYISSMKEVAAEKNRLFTEEYNRTGGHIDSGTNVTLRELDGYETELLRGARTYVATTVLSRFLVESPLKLSVSDLEELKDQIKHFEEVEGLVIPLKDAWNYRIDACIKELGANHYMKRSGTEVSDAIDDAFAKAHISYESF